jgi:hypothetical protein
VERQKQSDRILALLQRYPGDFVPLPMILDLRIASYTRRLHELREDGWLIETIHLGKHHTAYALRGRLSDEAKS